MKVGDIIRVKLEVPGFGKFEWEDEIESEEEGNWYILKLAKIGISGECFTYIQSTIPEGMRVECWNGGNDNSANMGWYVRYDKVKGQHLVARIKNMIEGRAWWDNARSVEGMICNEILNGEKK